VGKEETQRNRGKGGGKRREPLGKWGKGENRFPRIKVSSKRKKRGKKKTKTKKPGTGKNWRQR